MRRRTNPPPVPDDAETRASGLRVIRKVAPYLWPKDHPWVKQRVVLAMSVLVLAKIIAVGTPFFYKAAVDALAKDADGTQLLGLGAVALTIAYGLARLMKLFMARLPPVCEG